MAWSLLNHQIAGDVEKLIAERDGEYEAGVERFFSREKAKSIIHAAIWGYSARSDSDAGCYAFSNLMQALGIKRWSFKDDWSDIKINGAAALERAQRAEAERDQLKARIAELEGAIPSPIPTEV